MRIGFDAKRAFHNATGLGNYSRNVISSLSHTYAEHEYVLFTPSPGELFPVTSNQNISLSFPMGFWKYFGGAWRRSGIISDLKRQHINLFHGLSNELPAGINMSGIRSVVTIHDLIFLRYPELYPAADRNIYHRKSKHACTTADHIIAVSQQTKDDIIRYYGTNPDKISVIWQAVSNDFFKVDARTEMADQVKNKFNLPARFILSVGTIEKRKNLMATVKALKETDDDIHLVVIGKSTSYKNEVDEYVTKQHLNNRIHFLKAVSNHDLPLIYGLASLLAYSSRFEGFGLPIAEALSAGLPVIANDQRIFKEAGGPCSLYVNTDDAESFAGAIQQVMVVAALRLKMIDGGKKYAENFMPERQADEIMNVYRKVLTL